VPEWPTGTVTFLFTDVEGSTRLWEAQPEAMRTALARHDAILREAVASHDGHVVKSTGDGMLSVFASAHEALAACLDGQRSLHEEAWPESTGPIRVRMGVHAGEAELRDGDYYGSAVNRAARLTAVGHGGQVLASESIEPLVRGGLPPEATLLDLGRHRLRDLADELLVFQLSHPELVAEFAPLRSLDRLPGNLPRQVTTFVGRERELVDLAALVRERPVVTLTGVGGVGKTRLALQVAAEVAADFADGAWFCELAPIGDPGTIWDAVATTLGVPPAPGRPVEASVLEYLGPKRLMLVLDNCEHLLESVARVVDAVTRNCPGVAVLATSREGLALSGEQLVAVPSLGLPERDELSGGLADADAVRLFVQRAQDAKRDFTLTDHNAPSVAQLCRRLDGIPLAIELAAARVRSLSPQDLVGRLDQRFRLLTRGSRVGLERHQTLRSTIDWSYELLSGRERVALNRLSVFAGGCDLAAAEAVLPAGELDPSDVVDVLGQLVDKSLVLVDPDEQAGTRYLLLETIRQYAQEQLEADGEATELRARHADYFVGVAEAAGPRLRSREQLKTSAEIDRELDNLRAVLEWALEVGSADHALRLVAPLAVSGMAIGYATLAWADPASAIPGAADHELFPVVVAWASWNQTLHGDNDEAEDRATTALEAQERLGTAHQWVYMASAVLGLFSGDLDRAQQYAKEWVRRARAAGDPYDLSSALIMLSGALGFSNREEALPAVEEGVQIARDAGLFSVLATGLSLLGGFLPADSEELVAIIDETREVGLLVGDRQSVSQAATMQSWITFWRGDMDMALRVALEAAEQKLALGDLAVFPIPCHVASMAFARLQDFEAAALLVGVFDNHQIGGTPTDVAAIVEQHEAAIRSALGDEKLTALRTRGAAMPAADVVSYLRAQIERVLGP
jgi:predicted ATPase/class 3 adenylate cyclase